MKNTILIIALALIATTHVFGQSGFNPTPQVLPYQTKKEILAWIKSGKPQPVTELTVEQYKAMFEVIEGYEIKDFPKYIKSLKVRKVLWKPQNIVYFKFDIRRLVTPSFSDIEAKVRVLRNKKGYSRIALKGGYPCWHQDEKRDKLYSESTYDPKMLRNALSPGVLTDEQLLNNQLGE